MICAHLFATPLAQKCAPHCCELKPFAQLLLKKPFSPLLLAHKPFAKSMPIISARGRNAPVTYQRNFVSFYEGRRALKGVGQQPIYNPCIRKHP